MEWTKSVVMTRSRDRFKQKRSLGQVFLKETWPCKKMTQYLIDHKVEEVLEIGPGGAILTKELLGAGLIVTAVEKDSRLMDHLQSLANTQQNLSVIESDFLDFNIEQWLKSNNRRKAIVGNIPYNVSSPIVMKILPFLPKLTCSLLMFQLEFAERVVASENHKSYGSLSIYCHLRALTHIEFKIGRQTFKPVPKVDSAVVSFSARKNMLPAKELAKIEKVVRQAFQQRRKKLTNSIAPYLKDCDTSSSPIDLNRRCDSLSPQDFAELCNWLPDFQSTDTSV